MAEVVCTNICDVTAKEAILTESMAYVPETELPSPYEIEKDSPFATYVLDNKLLYLFLPAINLVKKKVYKVWGQSEVFVGLSC